MKTFVNAMFILIICGGFILQSNNHEIQTAKYGGEYTFGKRSNTGSWGRFIVYPESDTSILFSIWISRGAPSFNMGNAYGRIIVKNDSSIYSSNEIPNTRGCQWKILFQKKKLTIWTINNCDQCGFGGGVIADHIYDLISKKVPEYFFNGEGDTLYFSNISHK